MFNWFNADAAKNLGHLLAEHIVSNLPQEMAMENDRFLIKKQEVLQYLTMKIYQFNLMQQLFRYVGEGSRKDIATMLGLQSTLYGIQSLPAFQFINTHIVGQLSGNQEHRDAYDVTYGVAGRTAGDFVLYGIPSNILNTNIYSRA